MGGPQDQETDEEGQFSAKSKHWERAGDSSKRIVALMIYKLQDTWSALLSHTLPIVDEEFENQQVVLQEHGQVQAHSLNVTTLATGGSVKWSELE